MNNELSRLVRCERHFSLEHVLQVVVHDLACFTTKSVALGTPASFYCHFKRRALTIESIRLMDHCKIQRVASLVMTVDVA